MRPFKRARDKAQSTPVLDRTARPSVLAALLKAALVPVLVFGALSWWGAPALRVQYTWNGRTPPSYSHCIYLGLTGWTETRPGPGINQCPLVLFVPVDMGAFIGVPR